MMSAGHKALRTLIAFSSVGVALMAYMSPLGSLIGVVVLIVLTVFVVLDPGSRSTALLLGLHCVNWLASTTVPTQVGDWLPTLVSATVLLVIHLAATLASSLPPSAPLPRPTLRRWGRRALTVIGLSTPVWAALVTQTLSTPEGNALATYAAVASLAIFALAFWRVQYPARSTDPGPVREPGKVRPPWR